MSSIHQYVRRRNLWMNQDAMVHRCAARSMKDERSWDANRPHPAHDSMRQEPWDGECLAAAELVDPWRSWVARAAAELVDPTN
jgi:hypothetical protein